MKGRLYDLNPVAEIQSGYMSANMEDLYFVDLIDEKHQEEAQHHFDRARMGLPQNYETTLIQASGNRMDVNITNVPIIVRREDYRRVRDRYRYYREQALSGADSGAERRI